ncbi:MAG: hypothetical protein JWN57_1947 [Frankiales bacterium]|jgi:hypothetical protein|nr:hypothetical protein [Frankiales bacterium]
MPLPAASSVADVDAEQPTGVRYTRDVRVQDVGARVVLRRRHPEGGLGDVLGILESWAHGRLAVRRRDGVLVEVAEGDVVASKKVPPAPVRRP